jgi:DNA-binding transcriptional LysR family regulator
LANTLSFSETADHFRVPSSSVSRRIKDLEAELGATLFERTTRSVRLTDLGKLYLGEVTGALQSIEMADELVGAQSRAPTGMLRITVMPGYGERFVLPALDRLRQLYAGIDFDVSLTDQVVNLSGNEVDIAIRAASTLPEQAVARRLGDHEFVLVASPDYISQHGIPKTSAQLRDRPVFMYRAPYGILDWLALRDGVWKAIELIPKYVSNHGQTLLDSVISGPDLRTPYGPAASETPHHEAGHMSAPDDASKSTLKIPLAFWGGYICCINQLGDSSCESSMVAGGHEQLDPNDLQDQELVEL